MFNQTNQNRSDKKNDYLKLLFLKTRKLSLQELRGSLKVTQVVGTELGLESRSSISDCPAVSIPAGCIGHIN